ncbi:hypothetical protein AB0E69_05940 [Kribbella sp. NPDC026611]|uniref:hypothetical protein n=1 Tax=Kribbella sp. NPDC026611 TaxID=3154911 RepID=UPI0033CBACC0
MTNELKNLMDRASTRPDVFVPDAASLVATARVRQRRRRITGALMTVAVVLGTAAGGLTAVKLSGAGDVSVAGRPSDYRLCTVSTGRAIKGAWSWEVLAEVKDKYGSASVRRSGGQYAFCVSQPSSAPYAPLGNRGGILLRKSPINDTSSMTTVFGPAPSSDVTVTVQTGLEQAGNAEVKNGFYIYRHVDPVRWPGATPTATVEIRTQSGMLIGHGTW